MDMSLCLSHPPSLSYPPAFLAFLFSSTYPLSRDPRARHLAQFGIPTHDTHTHTRARAHCEYHSLPVIFLQFLQPTCPGYSRKRPDVHIQSSSSLYFPLAPEQYPPAPFYFITKNIPSSELEISHLISSPSPASFPRRPPNLTRPRGGKTGCLTWLPWSALGWPGMAHVVSATHSPGSRWLRILLTLVHLTSCFTFSCLTLPGAWNVYASPPSSA
ncbi:hypothetical protein LX32DRAFT_445044 [Colletotrichum zoysiae]|uniref:Uncharacterized protein n=1 Tax=Colletotrichum zoysiae TaxID=1216348 RepID=A0AAD9HFK0_9PEZI|nr:hypothetical protein LX32DRAFT_445044 [Colletotrichum zoysiae]